MSTPCVCRGGLTPCCCAHTRGGRRGGEAKVQFPARTSTLHPEGGDVQATRRQGGMDRFCVRVRTPTPPPLGGGRPSYKSTPHTEPSSSKAKAKQEAPLCTPQLPRPLGSSKLKTAHTLGRGRGTTKRWGDARG